MQATDVEAWLKEHNLVALAKGDVEAAAEALRSAGEEIRRIDPTVKLTGWDMDPALIVRLRAAVI